MRDNTINFIFNWRPSECLDPDKRIAYINDVDEIKNKVNHKDTNFLKFVGFMNSDVISEKSDDSSDNES